MHRRAALRRLAGLAGAAALAGCLGSEEREGRERSRLDRYQPVDGGTPTPPAPEFAVVDLEPGESEAGTVAVAGSLELAGEDAERTDPVDATVVVRVVASESGAEATERAPVTLAPGEPTAFSVAVDVSYESYRSGGRVSVDLEGR